MCHRYYLKKCFKKFVFFEQIFKKFYKFCRSNVNVEKVYSILLKFISVYSIESYTCISISLYLFVIKIL